MARHAWFREGLSNAKTELEVPLDEVNRFKLYSADLTAATEHITHDRARAIMIGIANALQWDEQDTNAAMELCGPQWLHLGKKESQDEPEEKYYCTSNSVLLGTGISWTVLSVLNAYCAYDGNFNDRSFKVCGDDLQGAWTAQRTESYQQNIQKVQLVLNRKKSFLSRYAGVFCERWVVSHKGAERQLKDGRSFVTVTRTTDTIGLREATAARLLGRPGRTGLMSVRHGLERALRSHDSRCRGPIRAVVYKTLSATKPAKLGWGPINMGGAGDTALLRTDGEREGARNKLLAWLEHGDVLMTKGASDVSWRAIRESLVQHSQPAGDYGTDLSTVLACAQGALARANSHRPQAKPAEKSLLDLRRTSRNRFIRGQEIASWAQRCRKERKLQEVGDWLSERKTLTRNGLRKLLPLLPNLSSSKPSGRALKRAIQITRNHGVDPKIDPITAASTLSEWNLMPLVSANGGYRQWGFLFDHARAQGRILLDNLKDLQQELSRPYSELEWDREPEYLVDSWW